MPLDLFTELNKDPKYSSKAAKSTSFIDCLNQYSDIEEYEEKLKSSNTPLQTNLRYFLIKGMYQNYTQNLDAFRFRDLIEKLYVPRW